ncbi:HAMP domain-containing sensor histidine kinase [Nocardioides aestuarii]|uniref:histidine kinase n=1 Tax=Nocardioides aestuarii TaxID=252231 RepID=A0ABW4TQE6_9ACTN
MRLLPRTLSGRLVLTTVVLVAVVALLVSTVATLAMSRYLGDRLDRDVRASLGRAYGPQAGFGPGTPPDADDRPGGHDRDGDGQGIGTLTAYLDGGLRSGEVLTTGSDGYGDRTALGDDVLAELADVPTDGESHDVHLAGLGEYRVLAVSRDGAVLVGGLPTDDVEAILGRLLTAELLLSLLGVAAAAVGGTLLVRRQLRPLRDVAGTAHRVSELPLATGDVAVHERVPERLTDEHTEVGQVGAALNTLLDHVETSLEARHRSEQQVRQFVADASHELRTPLATIQGYAELAERRPDDVAAVRQAVSKVGVEAVRMSALVEDLLLLARLDAGRPLEHEPVDLTMLLLEAVTDARVVAPDHHWRIELPDEPIETTGDGQRLHQVVTNLLTNARKYTPPGTTVTVSGDARGFSVRDDGPGFPPELVEHAFERFTRGDAARTREAGSSAGLGLALVQAIVTAHGGRVSLASRPGDTVVRVDLSRG